MCAPVISISIPFDVIDKYTNHGKNRFYYYNTYSVHERYNKTILERSVFFPFCPIMEISSNNIYYMQYYLEYTVHVHVFKN